MKTQINTRPDGSVLVLSLLTVVVIGITLGSYLILVLNNSRSTARSQAWNACVPVMEAGVEEAMSQIHYTGVANLSSNNWNLGTDGYYYKTRNVGTDGSYCKVAIQPVDPPVIFSAAYVPAPLSKTNFVVRQVRVGTRKGGGGGGGLNAKGTITLSGGALFDSYNSAAGAYNPAVHGTNAIAISNTNIVGSINMSGGAIYGLAVTGPGGTVKTSGSAAVGDVNWISTGNIGVQPGHWANDANLQFNDVPAPSTGGWFTSFTVFGTTNIAGVSGATRAYVVPTISSSGSTKPLLIYGDVTIFCTQTGNNVVSVSGSGFIKLMPGAKLTLYSAGNITISGGGIVNGDTIPSSCSIYGLPTCTAITYSGSSAFQGTVYAPSAAFTFSGGAGAFGAFTAKTILISGSGGVHFDESLGTGNDYVIASWNEL
jgi:hypothetical protein